MSDSEHDTNAAALSESSGWWSVISPPRRSLDVLAAVLTGVASAFALSGPGNAWLSWIAVVPALCCLYRSGFWRAFLFGAVAGVVETAAIWYWLAIITKQMLASVWLGIMFLSVLGLIYAVHFGTLYALIACVMRGMGRSRRTILRALLVVLIACLWAAFEYGHTALMMLISHIFPLPMGYAQWRTPAVIQVASIAGVYGVSFLIVLCNAALADSLFRRRFALIPWVAGFLLLCLLGGYLRLRYVSHDAVQGQSVAVAVLQGNIPAFDKFDRSKSSFLAHRYLELGGLANSTHPDLIVWTESAVPWPLQEDDELVTTMLRVTEPSHACHILGATFPIKGFTNKYYNSVFLVQPDGDITSQYDKRNLIPFLERTIHLSIMPASGTIHPAGREYVVGPRPPYLDSPFGRIGVMVCNENLYPPVARESAQHGGEFLVQLANDAWFLESSPINQHFAIALFRAVETGRDTVIANNVGISAIIDSCGRIKTRSEMRTHVCLSGKVERRKERTFYVLYGDLFAQVCAGISVVAVALSLVVYRRPVPDGDGRSAGAGARPPDAEDAVAGRNRRRDKG
ncbi:MAG: apolipoprotein N-acyltransferase, partial [Verrucomicrobia bacterium]|nr:apolipoprotein N-acyltransferase [Verrucomicrobiota bacterium]